MGALLICVAAATLGVDVGYQRLPDGGMECIIQIEPQTVDALNFGKTIQSDIPQDMGNIRTFRIMVGNKPLPHDTPDPDSVVRQSQPVKQANPQDTSLPLQPPHENAGSRYAPPMPPSSATSKAPPTLPLDSGVKPLVQQSSATEEMEKSSSSASQKENATTPPNTDKSSATSATSPTKPWIPLICSLMGLFASFGGNIFLVMVVWDLRKRCQSLLGRSAGS